MIYGPAYSSKSRVNVQSMETSREMLVEQLRKALSDLSFRLCQLHCLPPAKCQEPLRTLYKDQEICKYTLQACGLQACYLNDMNVEDSQEVLPYNWVEANAQLCPGRMFTLKVIHSSRCCPGQ